MTNDRCTCGLQSNGYVTRSATLCDACKAEASYVILGSVVEQMFAPLAEQMKAAYIAYLEAKLTAAKRGDWEEVARLKRNLHGHYGKFASGGSVNLTDAPCRYAPKHEAYVPTGNLARKLQSSTLYGKRADGIIEDDVMVWGTGHEQIIRTHKALDHIAAERAAMVVKPRVDPDDEIYGQAARGNDGQLLPKPRSNAPRLPGMRIADDGEVIREGIKKLEAERSAILNRPDPDLAPTIRPAWGKDAADLKLDANNCFVMAHCLCCSSPSVEAFLCSTCKDLLNPTVKEEYRIRYINAIDERRQTIVVPRDMDCRP